MQLKVWFKNKPAWFKGGLIGLGIYIGSVLVIVSLFMIGRPILDKHTDLLPHGSLGFLIPFMVISFYPGILFAGSYEAIGTIVPLNLVIYFLGGAILGTIVKNRGGHNS